MPVKLLSTQNPLPLSLTFSLIVLSFLLPRLSQSAVMPSFQRLLPITSSIYSAVDVATDQGGRLYVANSSGNSVVAFDTNGVYSATLSGLSHPLCVAVTADGSKLYVGNKDTANVEVYNSALTSLGTLGSGNGEFVQPSDLTIDSAGFIYVVDRGADIVKIYNPDGTFSSSFGGSGNGDGKFHHPLSIGIDEGAGELIVLDRQLSLAKTGIEIDGARIQVFDMNGGFKRGFTLFGSSVGELFMPQQVAVDDQGGLYITDSYYNVVLMYDGSDGTYLGSIYNLQNPLRTPTGLALGGDNLYVASRRSGTVEKYRIDRNMGVSPLFLTFQGQEGGTNPAAQSITITNNDTNALNWSAVGDTWITMAAASGTISASASSAQTVGVDLTGLTAGTYSGAVNIDNGMVTVRVDVELTVTAVPKLSVTPSSLTFSSTDEAVPATQSVSIENISSGEVTWTAAKSDNWLTLSSTTGTIQMSGTSTLEVGIDPSGLAAGTYNGSVEVSDGTLTETINVALTVILSPRLSVAPTSLTFISTDGSVPPGQVLSIANIGSGTLNWNASSSQSWIQLDKTSGTGAGSVTADVDITSLVVGDHLGEITLSGVGALSSPTHIGVTLTIVESSPPGEDPPPNSGGGTTGKKKFPWILFMHLGSNR